MIDLKFLALHALGFHGYDTKIGRGKHAVVVLQERKTLPSQNEVNQIYCYHGSGRNSFLLVRI